MARRKMSAQSGVSLIEVLVAMLVVSFGVLALSGMLGAAARFGKTSEYRAVATLLASDVADRMRANKPAVATGGYELLDAYDPPDSAPPDAKECVDKTDCTGAELAAKDMAQWAQAIFYGLPGGQGFIAADNSVNPPVAADVWLAWVDPSASKDEETAGNGVNECPPPFRGKQVQPRCLYFRVGL